MKKKQSITCRPCKEADNWEIVDVDGQVKSKHYASKQSCVNAGKRLAQEVGAELTVENN